MQNNIKQTLKVSVIIPCYKVEKFLPMCLDSVVNQTLRDIEIICVNDGSPDNTLEILKQYAACDNRIKIINQKNHGLSYSRNRALKVAKGEYVLFLDSDDWIREDSCDLLYKKSKKYNLDTLNFAGINYDDITKEYNQQDFQKILYVSKDKDLFNRQELEKFLYNIPISACRFFYRRDFLSSHNIWFPEGINFEDNYFVRHALLFVQNFGVEQEVLYFRRVHSESITQNISNFFMDYIHVVELVENLYENNDVDKEIIKKIISPYFDCFYNQIMSFKPEDRKKYTKTMFDFYNNMNQKYNIDNPKFNIETQYAEPLKNWYREIMNHNLNLDNPKTLNEKIQWLKIYDSTPIKTKLADKYLVRDWVAEKIGDKYLIPLIGVYDSFDEIDFDKLPNRFVIKCNHGSSWNKVVLDKSKIDIKDLKENFDKWMNTNFAFICGFELHYRDIPPKIIVEKFISNDGKNLWDYKFWCFNGKVKYMQFRDDFSSDLKMVFYDMKWRKQPFYYDHPLYDKELDKPDNFDEMVKIAEKLCQGFAFVCVDLYRLNNGEIKFGEMTFTRSSGIGKWNKNKYNRMLGKLIQLPKSAYNIDSGEYYKLQKSGCWRKLKPYLFFLYYWLASLYLKHIMQTKK